MTVQWMRLGDLLTQRGPVRVKPGVTYPIAGVYGFARGMLLRPPIESHETKYKSLTEVRTGDVVYSKLKAFEGAIAVAGESASGHFVSQEFPVFEPAPSLNRRYLSHMLASPAFLASLATLSSGLGARRERVRTEQFLTLKIPVPPRVDQDRIADHLDSLAEIAKQPRVHNVSELRERTIYESIRDAPQRLIGDLVRLERRRVMIQPESDYREIGLRSFGRGVFVKDPILGAELGDKKVYEIREGDLLISNVFAWEGAVGLATAAHDGLIGSHRFMTWTANRGSINLAYLREYLRTPRGIALLAEASPGSAGRNRTLSIENLKGIAVPLPDSRVQGRLALLGQRFDELTSVREHRDTLAAAILPAARNEIFAAMR